MRDDDCVRFLQWALPRMGMRWEGFRKPRGQVCKRIARRMAELGVGGLEAYRERLAKQPEEWRELDRLCRVTISRFRRDHRVFEVLGELLPGMARRAAAADRPVRAWSAGCASGEEAHTLTLLWRRRVGAERELTGARWLLVASDLDPHMLWRARRGRYPAGSLRELPDEVVAGAFAGDPEGDGELELAPEVRRALRLFAHDVRAEPPRGPFDLLLCRNLAFTYFAEAVQREVAERLVGVIAEGGALVIGAHEELPGGAEGLGLEAMEGCGEVWRRP